MQKNWGEQTFRERLDNKIKYESLIDLINQFQNTAVDTSLEDSE